MDPLTILSITIPLTAGLIYAARIMMNRAEIDPKIIQKRLKNREEYIDELEADIKSLTNQLNSMQRGPKFEGEWDELKGILPDFIGQFTHLAPNWLKPMLNNKDFQGWILEYATKNPEKAAQFFTKIIKRRDTPALAAGRPNTSEAL
jgi:hypothetical protein